MTVLKTRYHDIENKIVSTSSGLLLIEEALKAAKDKNHLLDIENLKLAINSSLADLQEVEKGLGYVKNIAYKVCDKNKDHDNLIFLDENKKILITHPDIDAIEALKSFFLSTEETKNASIFFATSIIESLDILSKQKPSLAFLDLELEKVPAACLNVLKSYKDKTKMVILSKNDVYKKESLDDGALTFIIKPLQLQTYVKTMVQYA